MSDGDLCHIMCNLHRRDLKLRGHQAHQGQTLIIIHGPHPSFRDPYSLNLNIPPPAQMNIKGACHGYITQHN